MRKFQSIQWGHPHYRKWGLFAILVATLGFNLSWDPQNTQIARYESGKMNMTELAQTASPLTPEQKRALGDDGPVRADQAAASSPAPSPEQVLGIERFNLDEISNEYPGIEIRLAINSATNRISYNLKKSTEASSVCTDCVGVQVMSVDAKEISNPKFLKMIVAEHAIKKIKEQHEASQKKDSKKDKSKEEKISFSDRECRKVKLTEGKIDCLQSLAQAATERCEDLQSKFEDHEDFDDEKSAEGRKMRRQVAKCQNALSTFVNAKVAPAVRGGLLSNDQLLLSEAVSARDSLMEFLPDSMKSLRIQLIESSAQGVLNRTKTVYDNCTFMGVTCTKGVAANQAQKVLSHQLNSVGGSLITSIRQFSAENGDQTVETAFRNSFYNPIYNLIKADGTNGLTFPTTTAGAAMPGVVEPGTPVIDEPATGPGTVPSSVRGANASRGTAPTYTPTAGGAPAGRAGNPIPRAAGAPVRQ